MLYNESFQCNVYDDNADSRKADFGMRKATSIFIFVYIYDWHFFLTPLIVSIVLNGRFMIVGIHVSSFVPHI